MIKNDRQYKASLEQLSVLREGFERASKTPEPDVFMQANIESLTTDMAEIEADVKAYEHLRSERFDPARLKGIGELGAELVRARIACNLTQRSLAEAVGKHEQVIQRYEATNYRGASLESVCEIANAICTAHDGQPPAA
jgi:HTH-type transcriptional regulator / antitoxin HigA